MAARAECLTLMPGQPANAGSSPGTGPPSLVLRMSSLGGPFATPRARWTVSCHRTSFAHSNRSGWRMVLGAGSGMKASSLRSSLEKSKQPGVTERVRRTAARLHRADTPARQVSARFRPRTMTDSPALHPLHSAAAIRKQRRSAIASFRRPQTGETVRKRRARPKKKDPEAAMLRISAKTSNSPRCFARARHRNTARGSACRRGQAIWPRGFARPDQHNREHGHFPTATLRWRSVSPLGKMADLTDKTKLV